MNISGPKIYSGNPGTSAYAKPATAHQIRKRESSLGQYAQNFDEIAFCDSLKNCLSINFRIFGDCSDSP